MKKFYFLIISLVFLGCSTSISTKLTNSSYQNLESNIQVLVIEKNDTLPDESEFIGDIKVGDTGFTVNCGYDKVLEDVTNAAKKSGANIVQIVEVKQPTTFGSSCYRITAKMYRNLNSELLLNHNESNKLKNKSRLPEDADYAVIHFYRPKSGLGALLGYKIKTINDSVIGRLRNGEKFVFKTNKFGLQKFYASIETKEEIEINVEKGQEYFVKCGIKMGVAAGRPEINLVENYIGIKEFDLLE